MRRRRPLSIALSLWAAAAVAAQAVGPAEPAAAQQPEPPNLLIIVTDDQRAKTLSVMPHTRAWFKRRGLSFPDATVTTPLCCPSRASIFTGRYAHNHGVQGNNGSALDPSTTIQHTLSHQGYQTGIVGKYLNNWNLSVPPPDFDRWAIFNRGYFGSRFNVNGLDRTIRRYSTDFISTKSGHFLDAFEADDDSPWLLFVTPYAPHRPATPAPRHEDAPVPPWKKNPAVKEKDRTDKPPFVQSRWVKPRRVAKIRAKQLRSQMAVDDLVEDLMQRLGELGERGSTLAVFMSDNGLLWREHGILDKRLPYLPSVSVPLLLRWPGHLPKGATASGFAANIDIAPTALEAAGVAPPATMDGTSLLSLTLRERLLIEYWEEGVKKFPTWASTLTVAYQYTEYYAEDGVTPTFIEYYDLSSDPWQLENLLGNAKGGDDPPPGTLAVLSQQLATDRQCQGTTGPVACP